MAAGDANMANALHGEMVVEESMATSEPALDLLADQRTCIPSWLQQLKFETTAIWENPHSRVGTPLYNTFVVSWQSVANQAVRLVFHGTPEANIEAICRDGLDPQRRNLQVYGPGEYFGGSPLVAHRYCKGGTRMLVFAVIVDKSGLTTDKGSLVVVNKPAHQLPLFVLTFDPATAFRNCSWKIPHPMRSSVVGMDHGVSADQATAVTKMMWSR
jgi:hypothetical protein